MIYRIETEWGCFGAVFSQNGLYALHFPDSQLAYKFTLKSSDNEQATLLESELNAYIAGDLESFSVSYDISRCTEFRRSVWQIMSRIPYGGSMQYGEVAKQLGKLEAAQAVGQACGANPVPLVIPCHRVVAKNGLGGFSAGTEWKLKLIEHEKQYKGE